ncbi:MAG: hypothetical protein ACRDJC_26870 [Thermomicrobiales bacterium]
MTANADLVERSGDLKRELVDYAQQPRFDDAFRQAIEQRFDGAEPIVDEDEIANFLDWMILEVRLPDGRTVVEHFVADHPELTEEERTMLLGWLEVVEGIFEVERRDGAALIVVNLVDDLTYRVRSNMGTAVFAQMPRQSFFVGRIVPIADEWLLSGTTSLLPAASRDDVYRMAVEFSAQFPAMVFRNPEKLKLAWEMQREERRHFVDFFGADLVVVPGREVAARMQAYMRYRTFEARNAEGKTVAELAKEAYGAVPPEIPYPTPSEFAAEETVGIIYDEVDGLSFYTDFGVVEETFANPALASDRRHRQAVLGYLEDSSITPLPFWRLADRDPERASQVFRRVLKQPSFTWERDGEALLRQHKASDSEKPVLPSVMPVSTRLARVTMTPPKRDRATPNVQPARDHPKPDFQPTRRRKKGSWKSRGWRR